MQVYTVTADHVVWVTGIEEEVWIDAGIDAGLHETEGVLRNAGIILIAMNDQQVTLQVASQITQVGLLVSIGIGLWGIHIAFSIHHFVERPVYHRASSHSHLEDIVQAEHHAGGHVASKAPTVNTDAILVHIGEIQQEFGTLGLVFGFLHA